MLARDEMRFLKQRIQVRKEPVASVVNYRTVSFSLHHVSLYQSSYSRHCHTDDRLAQPGCLLWGRTVGFATVLPIAPNRMEERTRSVKVFRQFCNSQRLLPVPFGL